MEISVIIPSFQRRDMVLQCVKALFASDFPLDDFEVIVCVDGSTDETADALRGWRAPGRLVVLEQPNRGQSAARNAAVRASTGELLLFVDDDDICGPVLLAKHVRAHAQTPGGVIVGSIGVHPDTQPGLPTELLLTYFHARRVRLEREGTRWPEDAMLCPNTSIARELFDRFGGYDETMRSVEDIELGLKLWKAGVPFRYLPGSFCRQIYRKSVAALVRRDAYHYGRGMVTIGRLHPEFLPYASIARVRSGSAWKRMLRAAWIRCPVSPEILLAPATVVVGWLRWLPWFRKIGMKMVSIRAGRVMYRAAMRDLGGWQGLIEMFGQVEPRKYYHYEIPPESAS